MSAPGRLDIKPAGASRWHQLLAFQSCELEQMMTHSAGLAKAVQASGARIVSTPPDGPAETVWTWTPEAGWRTAGRKLCRSSN